VVKTYEYQFSLIFTFQGEVEAEDERDATLKVQAIADQTMAPVQFEDDAPIFEDVEFEVTEIEE